MSMSQPPGNLERINRWLGPNEQRLQKHHRSINKPCFLRKKKEKKKNVKRKPQGRGGGVSDCRAGAAASSICQCTAFRNVYI